MPGVHLHVQFFSWQFSMTASFTRFVCLFCFVCLFVCLFLHALLCFLMPQCLRNTSIRLEQNTNSDDVDPSYMFGMQEENPPP